MELPQPKNEKEFDSIDRENPAFRDFILRNFKESLPEKPLVKAFDNGSCPTFSISDEQVAKFFPDLYLDDFENELSSLSFTNTGDVGSPRVLDKKSLSGWHVILMEQMLGTTLNEVWDDLSFDVKSRLAYDAGKHIRRLHSIGRPKDSDQVKWASFINEQRKNYFEKQSSLSLRKDLLDQLPSFLESVDLCSNELVFLHTEVMTDHFMVNKAEDEFSISGLIDFEPAMWGDPEYEFAAVGLFISEGNKELFKRFLEGYDLIPDSQFHRRVMAYTILHKYSNLPWFIKFMPGGESIEDLAEKWFAI